MSWRAISAKVASGVLNMSTRIRDIAEQAGVSSAAVSFALNNKPGVGQERRSEIIRIAKQMGYRRSGNSRSESSAQEGLLCFLRIARHGHIVNRDHDVFIADYIDGLSRGCEAEGYQLQISTFTATEINEVVEYARELGAAGLIILGTELSESDVAMFRDVKTPLVFIDTLYRYLDFDFVDMNNEDSVHAVVSEFVSFGHSRLGMINGDPDSPNLRLRRDEFRTSLLYFGLKYRGEYCFSVDPTFHGAYRDMNRLLESGIQLPTGVFCANDIIAAGCMKAFKENGIRIPEDLSVIGFDDLPLAAIADPPLTSIKVSKARIGRIAIRLLSDRIKSGNNASISKVVVSGKLIKRESVAAAVHRPD